MRGRTRQDRRNEMVKALARVEATLAAHKMRKQALLHYAYDNVSACVTARFDALREAEQAYNTFVQKRVNAPKALSMGRDNQNPRSWCGSRALTRQEKRAPTVKSELAYIWASMLDDCDDARYEVDCCYDDYRDDGQAWVDDYIRDDLERELTAEAAYNHNLFAWENDETLDDLDAFSFGSPPDDLIDVPEELIDESLVLWPEMIMAQASLRAAALI